MNKTAPFRSAVAKPAIKQRKMSITKIDKYFTHGSILKYMNTYTDEEPFL